MGSLEKRVDELELARNRRQRVHGPHPHRNVEELYRECENPEVFIRFDKAMVNRRSGAEDAEDEYRAALGELRAYANARDLKVGDS